MEQINHAVANNLKAIREQKKLSLDGLAKVTGVSKSMLAQIEKGDANPTIGTVWKIASGLKISFTELMAKTEMECEVIDKREIPVLVEDEGRYRNYPIFPYDDQRKFEIYDIELDPGAFLMAEAHTAGTQEFITVYSGAIEICVDQECLQVKDHCSVRFKADRQHSYKNISDQLCRISMVISYAG